MAYDIRLIEKVNEIFDSRRKNAESALALRKAEVYKKVPRIKEIDNLTRMKYREMVMNVMGGKNLKKSEIKSAAVDLRAERGELLVAAGYPVDYLELKFECKKCSDTGFYKNQPCTCYIKELNKLSAGASNLSARLEKETFKNFRLDYYADETDANGKNPRKIMERVFELCRKYAEEFSLNSGNLFFNGATGLGKTYLSSAIAGEVMQKGNTVIYDSAQNIIDAFESYKFGKPDAPADLDGYTDCDLLIIDDLGTEFITQYSISVIYTLLNNRINAHKPTIVSSNIDGETLSAYYPQSIVSRLSGEFITVPFIGTDIRTSRNGRSRKARQ